MRMFCARGHILRQKVVVLMAQLFSSKPFAFVLLEFHLQGSYDTNSYSAGKENDGLAMFADILYQT